MKNYLLIYALVLSNLIHGQQFSEVILDPFNIDLKNTEINDMEFADFTGDGAFDIIFNDYEFDQPFILVNQGTSLQPEFLDAEINNFSRLQIGDLFGYGQGTEPSSRFIDLDFDGDLDHVFHVGDNPWGTGEFLYEKNLAEMDVPGPTKLLYAFDSENPATEIGLPNTPGGTYEFFDFVDLDGDGDQDMFAVRLWEYENKVDFVYYESLFSHTVGMFNGSAVINPFGLEGIYDDYSWGAPAFFDLENDGDMDLLVSTVTGDWAFYENIGDANNPMFGTLQINPFGLTNIGRGGNPYFLDMNNDGWKDLIVGAHDHVFYFPFNALSSLDAVKSSTSIQIWPNPTSDVLNISSSEQLIQSYTIYNNIGKVVNRSNSKLALGTIEIPVDGLHSGAYLISIENLNRPPEVFKFIKL